MKKIIILLTVLLVSVVGEAQVKDSIAPYSLLDSHTNCFGSDLTIKFNTRGDYGFVKERGTLMIIDSCCSYTPGDNMFWNLPKSKTKIYSEPFYKPCKLEPYLSDDGTWIRTKAAAKKDTIVCLKSQTTFSKEDKEYIRNLVISAYYNGFNRNATVLNKEMMLVNKMKKDLKKLNAAIDKSFK